MHITKYVLISIMALLLLACADEKPHKTRIIVLTDITNEPDDQQSLVRFLLYANEFDVEGIIATTSCWLKTSPDKETILKVLDAYGEVQPNLLLHSPDYPSAEYLKSVTKSGVDGFAMEAAAQQLNNEGIDHIISVVDKKDSRPVWIVSWGGSNTLGGAVMKVMNTRSPEEAAAFVSKIRGYEIALQDDGHAWIAHHYPDAFLISSKFQWRGMSRTTPQFNQWADSWGGNNDIFTHEWIAQNIQSKGPLGASYPDAIYLWEGDTPSFLYLIPNGLGDPEKPHYGSWGGRFGREKEKNIQSGTGSGDVDPELRKHEDYYLFSDAADSWNYENTQYNNNVYAPVFRWREAYQNDFQARTEWSIKPYSETNHPPVAVFDGKLKQTVKSGTNITLSAKGSYDPDGDELIYQWMFYPEPGTFEGDVMITDQDKMDAGFVAPNVSQESELHIILSVTDSGSPRLTRYQRIIFKVVD